MAVPAWLTATPIAHRGLHDRRSVIENTIGAARAAMARGFALECDVQITADGEAVVFHDFTLDRLTTGSGPVAGATAAALAAIPFKATTDRIPTLADFLATLAGAVPLVCEIKSAFDGDMRLARRTAEVVAAYDGPVALKSFDPAIVAALRELAPDRPRGIVGERSFDHPEWSVIPAERRHAMANLLHFEETRPDFISWHVRDLDTAVPFLCRKAAGLPVMTWTVRTADDRAMAARWADQMVFEDFVP
ncbi:MAG: glycerophosphodiester phosphodiesterase family protein [Alsobacter sp.]